MNVRKMRVLVHHGHVLMQMVVRLSAVPIRAMCMLMMRVVRVHVAMFQRLMGMIVLMALGQVQPDADAHQRTRRPERGRYRFTQQHQCQRRANERRG